MDHIGIDVHKKESQICILTEGGELIGAADPPCPPRRQSRGGASLVLARRAHGDR